MPDVMKTIIDAQTLHARLNDATLVIVDARFTTDRQRHIGRGYGRGLDAQLR